MNLVTHLCSHVITQIYRADDRSFHVRLDHSRFRYLMLPTLDMMKTLHAGLHAQHLCNEKDSVSSESLTISRANLETLAHFVERMEHN